MKYNTVFCLFLFLFVFINIFSFVDIPQRGIFYSLKLAGFIGLALLLFIPFIMPGRRFQKINISLLLALKIWMIALFLSLLLTKGSIFEGLFMIMSYVLLGLFAFILLPNRFNNLKEYRKINYIWFLATLFGLSAAVFLSFTGVGEKFYLNPHTLRLRYSFSFINPNFLGSFCYILILIAFKRLLLGEIIRKKIIINVLLVLTALYILILSDSRTPLYALLLWVTVFAYLKVARNPAVKFILNAIITGVLLIVITGYSFNFQDVNQLLSYRLTNWMMLFEKMNGYEWFWGKGIGIRAEDLHARPYDNSYISLFVQTGLVGLGAFLLFMMVIGYKIMRIPNYKLKSIAIATIISWIVYGFFESSFFSLGNLSSIYIWSDIGLLISMKEKGDYRVKSKVKLAERLSQMRKVPRLEG